MVMVLQIISLNITVTIGMSIFVENSILVTYFYRILIVVCLKRVTICFTICRLASITFPIIL